MKQVWLCPGRARKSIPDSYAEQLISEGLMTEAERDNLKSEHYTTLNEKLSNTSLYSPPPTNLQGRWGDLAAPQARVSSWDTGLPVSLLQFVGAKSVDIPEHIHLHSHLGRTHVQVRPAPLLFLCHQLLPRQQIAMFGVDSGSVAEVGRRKQTGLVHGGSLGLWLPPLSRLGRAKFLIKFMNH